MISDNALLISAKELFDKEVENNPPEDVEVKVDWGQKPYSNAFIDALEGKLYETVESDLYDNTDFYEETCYWLNEIIYPEVKEKLIKLHDLDMHDDEVEALVDEVMESLKTEVSDGDISYPSCCPVINNEEIDWLMTFNDPDDQFEMGGFFELAKSLSLHASNLMSNAALYTFFLKRSITNKSAMPSFLPQTRALKNINLMEDALHEHYVGFGLKMSYKELTEINEAVLAGNLDKHIRIENPCLVKLDANNGGGDYDYVTTQDDKIITLEISLADIKNSRYINIIADKSFQYGVRDVFDTFAKQSETSLRDGLTTDSDAEDRAIAEFHYNLVCATINADPIVMEGLVRQESLRAGKFEDIIWTEMIGDWTLMHYAALIENHDDRQEIMLMLKNKSVAANVNGPNNEASVLVSVADLVLGEEWIKARMDGEMVSLLPSEEQLDLLARIGADVSTGQSILTLLEDQDARRFVISGAISSMPATIPRTKSLRL